MRIIIAILLLTGCAKPADIKESIVTTNPTPTDLLQDTTTCVEESGQIQADKPGAIRVLSSTAIGAIAGLIISALNPAFIVPIIELGRNVKGTSTTGVKWYHIAAFSTIEAAKDELLQLSDSQREFIRECLQVKGYPVVWING